jgi:hypothetical protein
MHLSVADLKNLLPQSLQKNNTAKMKETSFSEILLPVYQAIRRAIPEYINPDTRRRDYLVSHKTFSNASPRCLFSSFFA